MSRDKIYLVCSVFSLHIKLYLPSSQIHMYKRVRLLFLLISALYSSPSVAQVFPREGARLYYRIIGFSFPAQTDAVRYTVDIASGNFNNDSDFEKNIVTSLWVNDNKVIAEVPAFGHQYTWRTVSVAANNTKTPGELHHFSTLISPDVDKNYSRLRVTKSAEKYKDDYVLLDGFRAMYDMEGNPVWFLPGSEQKANQNTVPRDLKTSPQGTFTFIAHAQAYEMSYDGKVLWHNKGNPNTAERFHHDVTRLHDGHYMGLVFEKSPAPLPAFKDSVPHNVHDSARFYTLYSDIVEYDAHNNVVWSWKTSDYIKTSDLFDFQTTDSSVDFHENAFYFDEEKKVVYLSFRNINRIIKIKYPEGNVLNTYGTIYKPGITDMENGWFCGQHSCRTDPGGDLYLFNNNSCDSSLAPTIIVMKEPAPGEGYMKKIWDYTCTIDASDTANRNVPFISGGNVLELPDRSMFVSMGEPHCKVFIVSRDKKILWNAIPEKYDQALHQWVQPYDLYRATIITRKELEQLIWKSENL